MLVTTANAAVVAAIFAKLADARFQMRTVPAIMKDTTVTEGEVHDVAAQMGLQFLRRIRDNAPLVVRPNNVAPVQAQAISARATDLLNGVEGAVEFELSFNEAAVEEAEAESQDEDLGLEDC